MSPAKTRAIRPAKRNRVGGQRNRLPHSDQDDHKSDETSSNSDDGLEFEPAENPRLGRKQLDYPLIKAANQIDHLFKATYRIDQSEVWSRRQRSVASN